MTSTTKWRASGDATSGDVISGDATSGDVTIPIDPPQIISGWWLYTTHVDSYELQNLPS
jgi:hypothetical protein